MLSTGPITAQKKLTIQPMRYGSAIVPAMEKKAVESIAHIGMAEKLFKQWGKASDARKGGLSLEDIASRFTTVLGVYIPQGVISIKENSHIWETNGRNVVVWLMTFGLMLWLKSKRFGLNMLLDKFMQLKKDVKPGMGFLEKQINKWRLKVDYFDILKEAGIKFEQSDRKMAFWSDLDPNRLNQIELLYKKLQTKLKADTINEAEKKILAAIPAFQRRLSVFPLIATSLMTAATVYLIGGIAMKIVYKFIAPFDHDFVPEGSKQAKRPMSQVAKPLRTSLHQPLLFQSFAWPGFVRQAVASAGREGQKHV